MAFRKTGFVVDADDAKYVTDTGKKVVVEFYWARSTKHGEFPSYAYYSGDVLIGTVRHIRSSRWVAAYVHTALPYVEEEFEAHSEGAALSRATEIVLRAAGLIS